MNMLAGSAFNMFFIILYPVVDFEWKEQTKMMICECTTNCFSVYLPLAAAAAEDATPPTVVSVG